jgi:hypothetical protein
MAKEDDATTAVDVAVDFAFDSAVAGGAFFAVFAKGAQCIRYHNASQTPQLRRSSYGF